MAISHGASHRMHDAVKKREQKNNNLVKTYTDVADLTTTKQHLPHVHRSFLCLVQYLIFTRAINIVQTVSVMESCNCGSQPLLTSSLLLLSHVPCRYTNNGPHFQ